MSQKPALVRTFASIWLPSGQLDQGSETTVVVREARFVPSGQMIRALRAEHSGQIALGDRLVRGLWRGLRGGGHRSSDVGGAASRETWHTSFPTLECRAFRRK